MMMLKSLKRSEKLLQMEKLNYGFLIIDIIIYFCVIAPTERYKMSIMLIYESLFTRTFVWRVGRLSQTRVER